MGTLYGNPNQQYAGRVGAGGGVGRPDQAGQPIYRPRPLPAPAIQGMLDIYGNPTGRSTQYQANQKIGQPGGTPGGTGTTPGFGTINTSITPSNIYSPSSTLQATNQATATAQQGANWDWIRNMFARPGMSISSPGVAGAALPQYAGALAAGQQASVQTPYQDMLANAQHLLSGQQAREGEALGWGRLQSTLGNAQQNAGVSSILNILQQFMGG